jgi:hypothetical protein
MSAEYVVIYYGLKFPVSEGEVKTLLKKAHPYQITAKKFGLDCYWGDCSAYTYDYHVFIGKEVGTIGCEYDWNREISDFEMMKIMEDVKASLKKAGFTEEPRFLMHFAPDV